MLIPRYSAHAASVPVAVHLDHATNAEHLELAIGLAEKEGIKFDSIMVDASHADVSPPYQLRSPFGRSRSSSLPSSNIPEPLALPSPLFPLTSKNQWGELLSFPHSHGFCTIQPISRLFNWLQILNHSVFALFSSLGTVQGSI